VENLRVRTNTGTCNWDFRRRISLVIAPPSVFPLGTRKSLPNTGSPAALLPQILPPPRLGEDWFPGPGGRRLCSPCAPDWCPGSTVVPDAGAGSSGCGRARRAPIWTRGPCGAMNGTANPLLDREEHCLRLGESFEKRPRASFHTIRCKSAPRAVLFHMPASPPSFPHPLALQSPGNPRQHRFPPLISGDIGLFFYFQVTSRKPNL
jgi:hypothetical protein